MHFWALFLTIINLDVLVSFTFSFIRPSLGLIWYLTIARGDFHIVFAEISLSFGLVKGLLVTFSKGILLS